MVPQSHWILGSFYLSALLSLAGGFHPEGHPMIQETSSALAIPSSPRAAGRWKEATTNGPTFHLKSVLFKQSSCKFQKTFLLIFH